MIECRPFARLPTGEFGWGKSRRHFSPGLPDRKGWGALRLWNDEEIAPNAGFPLLACADVEIIIYVREGTVTHRDSLGNEDRIEAGNVQVISGGGMGIRHAEYNLEQAPARIFQIWIAPGSPGGSAAWGAQPCPATGRAGDFVAIASGFDSDEDALPIRAPARVLNIRLKAGQSIEHTLRRPRLAYLVPSSGTIDVNGVTIQARDGAAVRDVATVRITAIEDADIVMADVPANADRCNHDS